MLGTPTLFYMATALIATIAACRLQAWLAVRGLRFERIAPASVRVGDLVTVQITVWSTRKLRRPLIEIGDHRTARMPLADLTPSLPIAAAYDLPIQTQYQFRPLKRGRYRWSGLTVEGTDALGLVTQRREYETAPAEMTVLPRPIPVSVDLPSAAGWGVSEAESGQTRGAGLEPRGVRTFAYGDSLRHIHWRSTAKTGQLLVKEFEAGTHAAVCFLIQRTRGTDVGQGADTSLDLMCGHAVYLAEVFLRQGTRVMLPGLDSRPTHGSVHERTNEIYEDLAGVQADSPDTLGEQMIGLMSDLPLGTVLFVMIVVADEGLPAAIQRVTKRGVRVVPLVYDAAMFRAKRGTLSAADPSFIGSLRDSGSVPMVMPNEVRRAEGI